MAESHREQMERARAAFREAHARFVKRLSDAPTEAVERVPDDGSWSAAQIGWHVAAVDASFAGIVSGENPAAKPLPDGVTERPWSAIVQAMPSKIVAGKRVQPPPGVRRDEALAALADAAAKFDAALAGLEAERGAGLAITHPALGTITLRQFGDWATGHIIRHNAQAKRILGL